MVKTNSLVIQNLKDEGVEERNRVVDYVVYAENTSGIGERVGECARDREGNG